MVTVRSVVALAAYEGWYIYQINVHNAFLNGDLLEEVYMTIPVVLLDIGRLKRSANSTSHYMDSSSHQGN